MSTDRPRGPVARLLVGAIGAYQHLISPLLAPRCRFYPSCSEYARQAVVRFGALRGSWLAVRRLVRCQPWCAGGLDPVPERHGHSDGPSARSPIVPTELVSGSSTSPTGAPR